MIHKLFLQHPNSVGETYGEHFVQASWFGLTMLIGACACFVHAVVPGFFERTGSGIINGLHERMVGHRRTARRSALTEAAGVGLPR